jgi:hypothetical protein
MFPHLRGWFDCFNSWLNVRSSISITSNLHNSIQCKETTIETTPTQEMIVYHVRVGLSGCFATAEAGKCTTFTAFARAKVDITMR